MGDTAYVRPVVKIELGARSDTELSATPEIAPYVADVFPDEVAHSLFTVRAVAPERTFWEKAALLHEETYRERRAAPKARLARHYYDRWCLITRGVAERAASDRELFDRVAGHSPRNPTESPASRKNTQGRGFLGERLRGGRARC
jgi:hypothetical protein